MDQGANGMSDDPEVLGARAAQSRARLGEIVSELNERRHVVTRARGVLADNRLAVLAGGLLVAGLAGGIVALTVRRRRRRNEWPERAHRLRLAVSRMVARPERVAASDPSRTGKLMTAIATTAATAVVKRLVEEAAKRAQAIATERRLSAARPVAGRPQALEGVRGP
jgi:hypothetical protein